MGFLIVFYNQISTLLDNQKTNNSGLNTIFRKLEHDTTHEELRFLIELVNYFRPKLPTKTPQISIQSLIDFLNENPELLEAFRTYLYLIFNSKKFKNILSDAGILKNTHFFQEIKKRTIAKILPYQPDKNTLEFILNQVFYSRKDYAWFSKIPMEEFLDLYEILNLDSIYDSKSDNSTIHELLQSMRLIMQRMSGRALETDVIKMIPEYENFDSPFEVLEKEFDVIEEIIISNHSYFLNSENIDLAALKDKIERLGKNNQLEILSILKNTNGIKLNENKNGVFVNMSFLPSDSLAEIDKYVKYVSDQEKTLNEFENQKQDFKNTFFTTSDQ
jgi:site-specific recombinase